MKFSKKMGNFSGSPRNVLLFVAVFVVGLALLTRIADYSRTTELFSYSQFLQKIEADEVASVKVSDNHVFGVLKSGKQFESTIADNPSNWELLRKHNVDFAVAESAGGFNPWYTVIFLSIILVFGLVWFLLKQLRGGSSGGGVGGLFSASKSTARMFLPSQIKVKFSDVAGADEAKEELQDLVDFLKNPTKYRRLGAEIPRGVLLVGEPGNGKTLLAKAVAGEANCPFFSITGSDFMEIYVGIGAGRIRDLFAQARKNAPAIIFIDEIDAIGRRRGSGSGGGHDEREQTLNQLLTEMDGFASGEAPVIVLAATNMPSVLDRALLRPGRFDRRITVPFPDEAARRDLIAIHTKKVKLAEDIDIEKIVQESAGFSGADLANCVNQAAINATKKGRDEITQEDFDVAFKKLIDSLKASRSEHKTSGAEESSARVYMPSQIKVRFSDIAGLQEAKEEMEDFISYLKDPSKYQEIGARLTKGVLLVGDPGNGKTMLARAVAGEAGRPFFSASGSEFVEKYVGVGASRIRDLFVQARRMAPSIIFIDEIDAIGGKRGSEDGGNREYSQTLNQLLTEMDGFDADTTSVIVLAATNRPDILDSALTRAGRFDRRVDIPYPDLDTRRDILQVHVRGVRIAPEVNFEKIARGTPGFSGADLANLVNEAAVHAVRSGREIVDIVDFDEARDKILMGKRSFSMRQTKEDLTATAYHEAGHALMTLMQPKYSDPLHKVTIAPRGGALGYSASLPERDRYSHSKDELVAKIIVALGGRVAEELVLDKQFTGVTSDLKNATTIARRMVCDYGMSPELGLISCAGVGQLSQEMASCVDSATRIIVDQSYEKARELMVKNRDKLEKLAQALLERETLQAEEIYELLGIIPREFHTLN